MANEITKTSDNIEDLLDKVSGLIEQARTYVKTSVNTAEVYTKYYIGKYIVEYEQEGNVRAQYGKQVLQELSKSLTVRLGQVGHIQISAILGNSILYMQKGQPLVSLLKTKMLTSG